MWRLAKKRQKMIKWEGGLIPVVFIALYFSYPIKKMIPHFPGSATSSHAIEVSGEQY